MAHKGGSNVHCTGAYSKHQQGVYIAPKKSSSKKIVPEAGDTVAYDGMIGGPSNEVVNTQNYKERG